MTKRRAFTLVELLIVIGIIAVLAGLFLSTGRKAREQANATICSNNLRQLALAFTAYTQDNEDRFPHYAGSTPAPEDWIYWREPPPDPSREFRRSPILKYVKGEATRLLTCASDDTTVRPATGDATNKAYRFSYTMNTMFSSSVPDPRTGAKLSRAAVKDPSRKILLIEEAEVSINDGAWDPTQAGNRSGEGYLSTRHFNKPRDPEPNGDLLSRPDRSDRGVVAFADGHAETVSRADTWQPMHYDPRSEAPRDPGR